MAVQRQPERTLDRMPPQNIEAERSVLGAMLLNPDAVGAGIEILRENAAEVFYAEQHQHIYAAMVSLFRKNIPVDVVTLTEQLMRDGRLESCGGATYLGELTSAVPTSANIEYYAKIVLDAAVLRKLITACSQVAGEAYALPDDVNQLLDRAEASIFAIAEKRQLNPIYRVGDLLEDAIDRIEIMIKSHTGYTGLPTGFKKLDALLSGFQPADMIVIAARPSVGKTAFALNIASHLAIHEKKSVLIFSLEMAKEQLVQRLICMEGKIDSQRLRTGFLAGKEFPKLQRAADRLNTVPIYIDESPNLNVLEIRSKARRHKAQHDLDLIVIDYLQLMSGMGRPLGRPDNRQEEVAQISRGIKGIARELHVPVVALSQLSREAEKDDTGRPKLQHLRESGAIEQDADVVIMLTKPPAHDRKQMEKKYAGKVDTELLLEVIVAKQRNGPTGSMYLLFDRNVQHFGDLAGGVDLEPPPPGIDEAAYDAEDVYTEGEPPF